ncbi:MAG: hypothetical protein Q7W45_01185 [Bacteroidota bacterium]|nr:hypothetical protein [Bacteroidota bacterium]MDP3146491.1 hypothetical protein [Bacteroidota bacterium]MDP3557645.1 hypothetical protein [Bacteroidota bacterium]
MKDVIWTLIIVWLIYKLVDIFKSSPKKSFVNNNNQSNTTESKVNFSTKKDSKDIVQKSADKEGDYVDFEEIK